jgi:hypothetical protein
LNILLSKRYQAQSEQLKYIQGQLFDEAELEREIAETRQALDELQNKSTRSTGQEPPKQKPIYERLNPLKQLFYRDIGKSKVPYGTWMRSPYRRSMSQAEVTRPTVTFGHSGRTTR